MNRTRWLLSVAAVLAAGVVLCAAETLRIVPIVDNTEVLVSFELGDAYTSGVREAISSGLRTTFAYDVELRMIAPLWVDRTIVTVLVSATDQYDNLTRRHILSRSVDGHVQETLTTEDESVVGRWLTKFSRLPLCRTSKMESGRDYYLRISARSRPHRDSLLGWASSVIGQTKFTFVPYR